MRLRRRDAGDLVLMSADRAQQQGEVIDLTARLLAGVLRQHGGADLIRRVMPAALPWLRFLPAEVSVWYLVSPEDRRVWLVLCRTRPPQGDRQ